MDIEQYIIYKPKRKDQNTCKRILSIILLISINILWLFISHKNVYASIFKYIHSTYDYSCEADRCFNIQVDGNVDGNMPDDVSDYKIYLLKSQDINAPLNTLLDGGEWRHEKVFPHKNYLYTVMYHSNQASHLKGGHIIHIIDITDPQNPFLKNKFEAFGIQAVERDYLYTSILNIVEGDNEYEEVDHHLEILDIHDPNNPIKLGNRDYNGIFKIIDTTAYLYRASVIYLLDITDPINPIVISSLSLNMGDEWGKQLFVEQDYLYITTKSNRGRLSFYIISIKDPTAPYLIKNYVQDGPTGDDQSFLTALGFCSRSCDIAYISGNYLYIIGDTPFVYCWGHSDMCLKIVDISDPLNLKKAGEGFLDAGCSPGDTKCTGMDYDQFMVQKDYAYILREDPPLDIPLHELDIYTYYGLELYVVDLKDIINNCPQEICDVHRINPIDVIPINGSNVLDFQIRDNYGYFCLAEGGIQIVEIPVQCSNLHLVDTNTIAAEIAMPISPGTYNIVVEVTQEDEVEENEDPNNGIIPQEEPPNTEDPLPDGIIPQEEPPNTEDPLPAKPGFADYLKDPIWYYKMIMPSYGVDSAWENINHPIKQLWLPLYNSNFDFGEISFSSPNPFSNWPVSTFSFSYTYPFFCPEMFSWWYEYGILPYMGYSKIGLPLGKINEAISPLILPK